MIKTFFFVFCRQEGNCQYGAKCTREQKHYHDDHDYDGKLAETKLRLNQTCRDFPLSWFWKLIFHI